MAIRRFIVIAIGLFQWSAFGLSAERLPAYLCEVVQKIRANNVVVVRQESDLSNVIFLEDLHGPAHVLQHFLHPRGSVTDATIFVGDMRSATDTRANNSDAMILTILNFPGLIRLGDYPNVLFFYNVVSKGAVYVLPMVQGVNGATEAQRMVEKIETHLGAACPAPAQT